MVGWCFGWFFGVIGWSFCGRLLFWVVFRCAWVEFLWWVGVLGGFPVCLGGGIFVFYFVIQKNLQTFVLLMK